MNKRVSIVVPVFNSHATLPKCLDSLISQTYQDIEIICVNDKSKDNSIDIIREYQQKDPRVVLIDHEENKNAGGARNSGIKAATGTYVCFVDNDDWLATEAIEILINESNDCKIDYVAPDWCEYYNENRIIDHHNFIVGASKEENCEHALKYGDRMLGCLIRRDLFYNYNLFFPENSFFEDNAIGNSLLYCANDIKAVDKVLYYYYVVEGSSSRSINIRKLKDRINTTRLFRDNLKRLGFLTSSNKEMVEYRYLFLSTPTIMLLIEDGSKEAKKHLKIVYKEIQSMLPNSLLTQIRPDYSDILSKPIFLFYYHRYYHILSKIKLIMPTYILSWIKKLFV